MAKTLKTRHDQMELPRELAQAEQFLDRGMIAEAKAVIQRLRQKWSNKKYQ